MLQFKIFLFLCLFSAPLLSQTTFQKYITIFDSTLLSRKIVQTSDGNIGVTGVLEYKRPYPLDPVYEGILTKLSPAGDVLWTLHFDHGTALLVYVDDVEATSDGGMLVLMASKDDYSTKFHPSVVKVSSQGVVEWAKTIPGVTYFYFNAILPVNNGFLITGLNYNTPGTIVFKIDDSGNIIWGQNFDKILVQANRAAEDQDGNLYLPGAVNINNSPLVSNGRPFLLKLDAAGGLQWSKAYTDPFSTDGHVPLFLAFRKCVFTGDSLLLFSNNFESQDLTIMKTDLNGTPVLQKRFKTSGPESFFPLANAFADSNGEITVGTFDSNLENRPVVFQLSPTLDMTRIKSYRKTGVDLYTFSDIHKMKNEAGYLMTGAFFENGLRKITVIKTDIDGEFEGVCCARPETVFQGTPAVVTAADTTPKILSFPVLMNGTVSAKLAEAKIFPVCTSTSSMIAMSDTMVCPGRCIEVNVANPEQGATYGWSFPNALPDTSNAAGHVQVCFGSSGDYTLFLRQEGCLIDSSAIKIEGRPEIYPNAFTPNGDDHNEVFKPVGQCPVEEFYLQIFNRWGQRIFESHEPNEGWNGEVNGSPAPVDVYVYRVSYYVYINGVRTLVHNDQKEVTLLR